MIYDHRLLWLLTSYLVGWLMRYHLLWLLWLVMAWRIIPRIVYGITRGRGTRITKQLLLGWSSKSTNNGEMLGKIGELRGIKGMQVGLVRNSHSLGKFHITTSLFSLTGMMVRGIIPIWPNYSGLWISCWCTTSWEKRKRLLTDQHDQAWWFHGFRSPTWRLIAKAPLVIQHCYGKLMNMAHV